uniref:Phospholipase A2 n=1 Tax=Panagrolaimus sp. JU765 TaxID=591449 RepID=A0AC34PUL6_9BILA
MLVWIVLSLFSLGHFAEAKRSNATLKALWNLEKMSECRLGYTALDYNDYGCWCGVGGEGKPIDGIDECCMLHDHCYDKAVDTKMCFDVPFEYVEDYSWMCNVTGKHSEPICSDDQNTCKSALCWCDQMVVDCWGQYPKPPFKKSCSRSNRSSSKPNVQTQSFLVQIWVSTVEHLRKVFDFFI